MRSAAVLAACLALSACTLIAPHEEFRRGDASSEDLANAQQHEDESIRVGYDCSYSALGIIPICKFSPDVDRARAAVYAPTNYKSKTETIYFHKTYHALYVVECWEAWVRFEGVE